MLVVAGHLVTISIRKISRDKKSSSDKESFRQWVLVEDLSKINQIVLISQKTLFNTKELMPKEKLV